MLRRELPCVQDLAPVHRPNLFTAQREDRDRLALACYKLDFVRLSLSRIPVHDCTNVTVLQSVFVRVAQ